ncbi:hypothetical protein [Pseudomonas gorinensis]
MVAHNAHHQDQGRNGYHPQSHDLAITTGAKPNQLGVLPDQYPQHRTDQQQYDDQSS